MISATKPLLFDKVAVVHLEDALGFHRHAIHGEPTLADQLEWLEGQGLILRTKGPPQEFYLESGRKTDLTTIWALYQFAEGLREKSFGPLKKNSDGSEYRFAPATPENNRRFELSLQTDWARTSLVTRTTADYLTNTHSVNAVSAQHVPELLYQLQKKLQNTIRAAALSDVAQVVLNALPLPIELTPIEDLIAFKQDPEAKHRLLALRIWMRDLAKAKLPPGELEEKLEWLLHEYQSHMALHGLKTRTGTLETVITTTLEIAENLVNSPYATEAKKV